MSTYNPAGNSPDPGRMSEATRQRVQQELADGRDSTNPDYLYSVTHTSLLLAIADGVIDPVLLARRELASRGLNHNGTWVGFAVAQKLHLGDEGARR